jgi:hypothetical protein
MKIKYEILHVEIKSNHIYVSLKIIKNGSIELFNSVPIENVNLLVENFKLNSLENQV